MFVDTRHHFQSFDEPEAERLITGGQWESQYVLCLPQDLQRTFVPIREDHEDSQSSNKRVQVSRRAVLEQIHASMLVR